VRVAGFDPVRQPLQVKRRVGYMPDSVGFYDNLSARQNLRYSARLMGVPPAEANERIEAALAKVRLAEVADRRVTTFSHGMRQRLGLAEIWLKRAQVAILDEPTSGLDPQSTHEFLDMIRELRQENVAVLISSHMLDQVQSVCDRVALFSSGSIVLQGSVRELASQVLGGHSVVVVEASGSG
jgi:ABC-2 type transport system ATP-binding protein